MTGGGDLKLDFDWRLGEIKCHSMVDLALTSDGDLALTADAQEDFQQQLVTYWATPKGEMIDPEEGSSIYKYLRKPLTPDIIKEMELDIAADYKEFFPEIGVTSVVIKRAERNKLFMTIYCSDETLEFLWNPDDVLEFNRIISGSGILYTPGVEQVLSGGIY